MAFVHAIKVLATPISACWTASNEEDTPRTGPTNAPSASKRITCGFSRKAVNVAPASPSNPAQTQIKMTAPSAGDCGVSHSCQKCLISIVGSSAGLS